MTFFIMTKHIVATTTKAFRAIVQCLQRVKLTDFPNEDVSRYSAVVTSVANHLESCGKLPDDSEDIVYEGLMSTTVFALRNYLAILHTTENAKMSTFKLMLEAATLKFQQLIVEEKWLPKTKQVSSFHVQGESTPPSTGDAQGKRIVDHTPPQQGEPSTRKAENGRWDEHWCGNCRDRGRRENHSCDGHDAWVLKMKDRNAQQQQRKAAQATTAPSTTTATTGDTTDTTTPAVAPASATNPPDTNQTQLRPTGRNTHTTLRCIGTYDPTFPRHP
jgi:hypothetical protein